MQKFVSTKRTTGLLQTVISFWNKPAIMSSMITFETLYHMQISAMHETVGGSSWNDESDYRNDGALNLLSSWRRIMNGRVSWVEWPMSNEWEGLCLYMLYYWRCSYVFITKLATQYTCVLRLRFMCIGETRCSEIHYSKLTIKTSQIINRTTNVTTNLNRYREPSENKVFVGGAGGEISRKKVWCSIQDFHRILHADEADSPKVTTDSLFWKIVWTAETRTYIFLDVNMKQFSFEANLHDFDPRIHVNFNKCFRVEHEQTTAAYA